jgi:hypothetical protein
MTRAAELLDPKDVGEIDVIVFNFTRRMKPGETILASPVVSCVAETGADAAASAVLSQPAQVAGKMVLQEVVAGIEGVVYLVRCEAHLSSGRIVVLAGLLPVVRLQRAAA